MLLSLLMLREVPGTLMYSLDEGTLQASNIFTNVSSGPHVVTVIDTEGCTYFYL